MNNFAHFSLYGRAIKYEKNEEGDGVLYILTPLGVYSALCNFDNDENKLFKYDNAIKKGKFFSVSGDIINVKDEKVLVANWVTIVNDLIPNFVLPSFILKAKVVKDFKGAAFFDLNGKIISTIHPKNIHHSNGDEFVCYGYMESDRFGIITLFEMSSIKYNNTIDMESEQWAIAGIARTIYSFPWENNTYKETTLENKFLSFKFMNKITGGSKGENIL